jgi:hypothetical protein
VPRLDEGTRGRWLRLLLGAPLTVLGGVVLSVALGTGAAHADDRHDPDPRSLGSVLGGTADLVDDVVRVTTSTATRSTSDVVMAVHATDKKKLVTPRVSNVIPNATGAVTTIGVALRDTTTTTVDTVTDEVLSLVVDTVADVTNPLLVPGLDIVVPDPLSPALAVHASAEIAASTADSGALVVSVVTPASVGGANGIPLHFPVGPALVEAATPATTASGGSAPGHSPVSTTTSFAGFCPASGGGAITPESDELPSTPTFDTDTSPD